LPPCLNAVALARRAAANRSVIVRLPQGSATRGTQHISREFCHTLPLHEPQSGDLMNRTLLREAITLGLLACCAAPALASGPYFTVTSTGSGGTCMVDSTSDADCTLDAAITAAASGDHIFFAPSVQGQTITLGSLPLPNLSKNLTIDGTPNGVTIDGAGKYVVFYVDSGAAILLRRLTIQHGLGNSAGGGLYNSNGNVTIDSCTFTGNNATIFGGAIDNDGTLLVLNSTFSGNHSGTTSGAIYSGGSTVVANSTFAGNTADNNGGAMYVPGTLTVVSSIFAGNSAPNGPDFLSGAGNITSLGYNLVDDTTGSNWSAQTGDQLGVDPLLDPALLAGNGGPTETIALRPDSPARAGGDCAGNAGSPAIPPAAFDQRGLARSTPCTIGAFDMTSIFYGTFDSP
jgi:predicted outer membrane repeat protein